LGEGLLNDVVVIVLYQTVSGFQENSEQEFDTVTGFQILSNFCQLCLVSVLVGVVTGFAVTYMTKKFRYLAHSTMQETFLMISVAMFTYYLSEVLGQSGITSLVSCALVMAHYTWYNLSPQGKHVTSVAFQTLGYGAEAFVFSFIGLSVMYYKSYPYSWKFIIAEFFIVIVGRLLAIILAFYMFECFKGNRANKLSLKEQTFLAYAAMIRGAIAFGLVENINDHSFP
jgi:sodium/hydrogen exchanger-like protein 6/7